MSEQKFENNPASDRKIPSTENLGTVTDGSNRPEQIKLNSVARRPEFNLPARSYEITITTELPQQDIINSVHAWAITNKYQFGGAVSQSGNTITIFGEFPPNKFSQETNTNAIAESLRQYLGAIEGVDQTISHRVERNMSPCELVGVVGLKPGYDDATPFDAGVAEDVAQRYGDTHSCQPVTIFYNYKSDNEPSGFKCCEEPGVLLNMKMKDDVTADEVVAALSTTLKQTSIHMVVGSEQPDLPLHLCWKKVNEQTAREKEAAAAQSRPK